MPGRNRALSLAAPILLIAANVWIVWRAFWIDSAAYLQSLAGVYMALGRFIHDHGLFAGWFPLWREGMPFENTYQPLMHVLTALVMSIGHVSAPRAYFFVLGIAYASGPPALFLLIRRLTGRIEPAIWAGAAYSVWSVSAVLVPAIARDNGGALQPHLLLVLLTYADTPHAAGLALLPVALLSIDLARARSNARWFSIAAIACAAVVLTNIPAAIVLLIAVGAYSLAFGGWMRNLAILAASYALACALFPPSTIRTVLRNAAQLEGGGVSVIALLAWFAIAFAISRLPIARHLRFLWTFAFLTASVALGSYWFNITLVPQPHRFQFAMNLAGIGALAASLRALLASRRRLLIAAHVAIAICCILQARRYRHAARYLLRPFDMTQTSQYRIARWFDQHAQGKRVAVLGSTAFWLNAYTATPQIAGCCDQSLLMTATRDAAYSLGLDERPERSIEWLTTLGARYVAVSGPRSWEVYPDWKYPAKFEGRLPIAWREGDDTIYEVPDVSRHPLEISWESPSVFVVRGRAAPGERTRVAVAYHPGWRANLPLSPDALGFIAFDAPATGEVDVRFEYTGGAERAVCRTVSLIALLAAVLCTLRPSRSSDT